MSLRVPRFDATGRRSASAGRARAAALVTSLVLAACGGAPADGGPPPSPPLQCDLPGASAVALSFPGGDPGWDGGASDYPVAFEPQMGIVLEPRVAPGSDGPAPDAFYTFGHNFSDDLFLFIERRIGGLAAGGGYCVRLCVEFAADGIGHHLYGKAGAASFEPARIANDLPGGAYYVMNLDKGEQTVTGPGAMALGRLREWTDEVPGYVRRTLCTAGSMGVRADAGGAIWIFAGAESGFEVQSYVYWLRVDVELALQDG